MDRNLIFLGKGYDTTGGPQNPSTWVAGVQRLESYDIRRKKLEQGERHSMRRNKFVGNDLALPTRTGGALPEGNPLDSNKVADSRECPNSKLAVVNL